jgi:hypothetical protein
MRELLVQADKSLGMKVHRVQELSRIASEPASEAELDAPHASYQPGALDLLVSYHPGQTLNDHRLASARHSQVDLLTLSHQSVQWTHEYPPWPFHE